MAQSNPVAPRTLFVLPAGNGDPVTAPATGPVTAPLPLAEPVTLPVQPSRITGNPEDATGSEPGAVVTPLPVPLTPAERTRLVVAHWASTAANGAGQLWLNPGRLGHSFYYGKPGSLAEHRAYIKSREWRPEELKDHRSGTVIVALGAAYHLLIARPVKTACLIVSASADRPLRLTGLIAFLVVFAVFVLPRIPLI